jgi:hypothetical protein
MESIDPVFFAFNQLFSLDYGIRFIFILDIDVYLSLNFIASNYIEDDLCDLHMLDILS